MVKKSVGYLILFFLLAYIFVVGFYGDAIADYSTNQSSIIQLILYYATQTQFVIILIGSVYVGSLSGRILGGIGAGFLIDIASDMSSTPHCVLSSGFIQNAPNLALCSDTIYIQWMDNILPHVISFSLYYYIIPIILVFLAFEMLGVTGFIKYFKRE